MTAAPPLAGVRVVDLSWLLPGPLCTSLLADLGADVLKIERPGDGDYARALFPGMFEAVNRGKRSAVLDLREAGDRERLLGIAASADIFVEGFRPGVVGRLGVGYDQVSRVNPRIVYVSISGYGQSGPMAAHPGHDINFCAESGLLGIPASTGDTRPRRMQLPVSDLSGSMYAALAAVAALRRRDATGRGEHLDIPLAECALAWSAIRWADAPAAPGGGWKHVSPANDLFEAADGEWLALALVEEKFWEGFCDAAAGMEAGEGLDRRFPPRADAPREERLARHAGIARAIARADSAAWLRVARERDLPITKVATAFPAREMPGFPVRMEGLRHATQAPSLGADNERLAADAAGAWER